MTVVIRSIHFDTIFPFSMHSCKYCPRTATKHISTTFNISRERANVFRGRRFPQATPPKAPRFPIANHRPRAASRRPLHSQLDVATRSPFVQFTETFKSHRIVDIRRARKISTHTAEFPLVSLASPTFSPNAVRKQKTSAEPRFTAFRPAWNTEDTHTHNSKDVVYSMNVYS